MVLSFVYHYFAPMNEYKRLTIAYKEEDVPKNFERSLRELAKSGKVGPFIVSELVKIVKRRKAK